MVVQKTINNLKERPKEERKAVATSIAIGIIVILLIAWALLFFHRIQSAAQNSNIQPAPSATDTYESHAQPQQTNQFQTPEAATSTTVQLGDQTN